MSILTIEAKIFGYRRGAPERWQITLPDNQDDTPVTLRNLIEQVVRQEVVAYETRQTERRFLTVLSPAQITEGGGQGRITSGGFKPEEALKEARTEAAAKGNPKSNAEISSPEAVDPAVAVNAAWQAFEDGLYFVFVDGTQYVNLDAPVQLQPHSTLLLVRLVALAGG
jgi:hypothetical protein